MARVVLPDDRGPFEGLVLPGLPGGRVELEELFRRFGVTEKGREFVLRALTGEPERRVGGGSHNVIVRFASQKMKRVIQAESRTVELAFVELCEYDPKVRLYLCQPGKLFVRSRNAKGCLVGHWVTPDYLVLDDEGFALVECKPVAALRRNAASANPRFIRDASGWRWLAAEQAAAELGLGFRIFSSETVNPTWHRNIRFLGGFLEMDCLDAETAQAVLRPLFEVGSMRICEVLALPEVEPEVLWRLIAQGQVWADLERELLCEPEASFVHSSKSRMVANRHLRGPVADAALSHSVCMVRLEPGYGISWNGEPYTILNRGPEDVTLRPDSVGKSVVVSIEEFEEFVGTGAISGEGSEAVDSIMRRREELWRDASPKCLQRANEVYDFLREYWRTGKVPKGTCLRSLRRYVARYREGERIYGSGYAGLMRQLGRRPGKRDLGEDQQKVLASVAKEYMEDDNAGSLKNAHARLVDLCDELGISPVPAKETLRLELMKEDKSEVARKREGERAANRLSGPRVTQDPVIPRQADRIWQVAHVDHTLVDVWLVSSAGVRLGRAWLTLMIDDWSRMVLAMRLSFTSPSRLSVFQVLYDCLGRHGRVPDFLVVDQGSDFQSHDVEAAFAHLRIHKVERPAGKPRFGAVIERMFGKVNVELFHELPGNTKLSRRGRDLSSAFDPKRKAELSLRELDGLLEEWLFDVYPELFHESLSMTPREKYKRGMAYSRAHVARYVPRDDRLRIVLSSTPKRPTRRVSEGGTIAVERFRYAHKALRAGDVVGTDVPVKLDPGDASVVFARVRGKWVTCVLIEGGAAFRGRPRKVVQLLIEEYRKQRGKGAKDALENPRVIGRFWRSKKYGKKVAKAIERHEEERLIFGEGLVGEEGLAGSEEAGEESQEVSRGVVPDGDLAVSRDAGSRFPDRGDGLEGVSSVAVIDR